jgi:hypothetical protein
MEDYLDAYVAGWEIPDKDQLVFKANVRPWLEQPARFLYLARIDGKPAAAATVFIHERMGYLADATTAPSFRVGGVCDVVWPMLSMRMRTWCSAAQVHSPPVTATWSAQGCAYNSCALFGLRLSDQPPAPRYADENIFSI